jgi:hypothetical protein
MGYTQLALVFTLCVAAVQCQTLTPLNGKFSVVEELDRANFFVLQSLSLGKEQESLVQC